MQKKFCSGKCRLQHWVGNNPEKVKEKQKRWASNNPEKAKALWNNVDKLNSWRKANPEKVKAYYKQWALDNKEKLKANSKKWASENPDRVRASQAKYRESNPDKAARWRENHPPRKDPRSAAERRIHNKQQKDKRRQLPHTLTDAQWQDALNYFDNRCVYCGEKLVKAHMDHFIPAKLGGGLTKENIVPTCEICNKRKNAKNPLDWLVTQAKGLVAYVRVTQFLETR